MLNFDKYREKVEKLGGYSLNCDLAELRGVDQDRCDRTTCECCALDSLHWLISKYEPPLLKNGDGLKPGDWIMVRDKGTTKWRKRKFACCVKDWFYVVENTNLSDQFNPAYTTIVGYSQARLPEEGE